MTPLHNRTSNLELLGRFAFLYLTMGSVPCQCQGPQSPGGILPVCELRPSQSLKTSRRVYIGWSLRCVATFHQLFWLPESMVTISLCHIAGLWTTLFPPFLTS
jgi:hypothetical protein